MGTPNKIRDYAEAVKLPYKEAVKHAIRLGGGVAGGAKLIRMNRTNLYKFLDTHGIEVEVRVKRTVGPRRVKAGAR